MAWGGGTAGAVEVVGDLRVAGAGEEEAEHLGDHRRLLGIGHEPRLLVPGAGAGGVWVGLVAEAVAVGSSTAVAIALLGVLRLPAAHLAAELLDLELFERLEHVADQPSLGARLVSRGQRVKDLDARPRQLALEGQRVEQLSREPRGRVDDHRVEAAGVVLLGLADQLTPPDSVIAPPGLLVGEVADDLPVQLGGFGGARLPLRGEGERRVLLVLGREPAVPGELAHQALLSSVRSMNLRTRSDRDDAAVRRRRGVVRPRSRAW